MSRTKLLAMFSIVTVGLFLSSIDGSTAPAPAKNDPAAAFTLKLLNSGDLKSADLKGKVAVLKFVASY